MRSFYNQLPFGLSETKQKPGLVFFRSRISLFRRCCCWFVIVIINKYSSTSWRHLFFIHSLFFVIGLFFLFLLFLLSFLLKIEIVGEWVGERVRERDPWVESLSLRLDCCCWLDCWSFVYEYFLVWLNQFIPLWWFFFSSTCLFLIHSVSHFEFELLDYFTYISSMTNATTPRSSYNSDEQGSCSLDDPDACALGKNTQPTQPNSLPTLFFYTFV